MDSKSAAFYRIKQHADLLKQEIYAMFDQYGAVPSAGDPLGGGKKHMGEVERKIDEAIMWAEKGIRG